MPKLCNHCHKYPVWGGGFCKLHQQYRTDKKIKGLSKERKPTGEKNMFDKVWKDREREDGSHVSEISGKNLDCYYATKYYPSLFLHVLDKKNWPMVRLSEENIVIATPMEHFLVDQGTEAQREAYEKENNCSFKIFYERKEQLKQAYNGSTK
jgi:hypothetical protein